MACTIHFLQISPQTLTSLYAAASQLGATILNQAILPLSNDIVRFLHHLLHLLHLIIRHSAVISVCPFCTFDKNNGNVTIYSNASVILQVCNHVNSIMEAYVIDPLISSTSYQCPQYVRLILQYSLLYVVIRPNGSCHFQIVCCSLCAILCTHNYSLVTTLYKFASLLSNCVVCQQQFSPMGQF